MAVELIDGHAGEPHIDGSDAGIFKAGVCGEEGGILATSNKCACTINSNTSITIAEGELIMPTSGRLVRVKSPETLTITTGSASQKRNDLVVARYSKNSTTEIETVSLVVLRGTPTTGTPIDPATEVGDLKLYRLQLNGLTLQTPVKLAEDVMPITEINNSVKIGSGSTSFRGLYYTFDAYYKPGCNVVEIVTSSRSGSTNGSGNGFSGIAFTLAAQYRPKDDVYMTSYALINGAYFMVGIYVYKDGGVGFFASSEAGAQTIGAMPLRCTFTPAI